MDTVVIVFVSLVIHFFISVHIFVTVTWLLAAVPHGISRTRSLKKVTKPGKSKPYYGSKFSVQIFKDQDHSACAENFLIILPFRAINIREG